MAFFAIGLLLCTLIPTGGAIQLEEEKSSVQLSDTDPLEEHIPLVEYLEPDTYVYFPGGGQKPEVFGPIPWDQLLPQPDPRVVLYQTVDFAGMEGTEGTPSFTIYLDLENEASLGDPVSLAILDGGIATLARKEIIDILDELDWGMIPFLDELIEEMQEIAKKSNIPPEHLSTGPGGGVLARLDDEVAFGKVEFTGVPAIAGAVYLLKVGDGSNSGVHVIEPLRVRSLTLEEDQFLQPVCHDPRHGGSKTQSSKRVTGVSVKRVSDKNTDYRPLGAGGWEYSFGYWGACNSYNAKTSFYFGWHSRNEVNRGSKDVHSFGAIVEGDLERKDIRDTGHRIRMFNPVFFHILPTKSVTYLGEIPDGHQPSSSDCPANRFRNNWPGRVAVSGIPVLGIAISAVPDNWVCEDRSPRILTHYAGSPGRGMQIRALSTYDTEFAGGMINVESNQVGDYDLRVRGAVSYSAYFKACQNCHEVWDRGSGSIVVKIPFEGK